MEDENTPRGGGLGKLFSGSRARLLLIGGGVIALFLLMRHFAQNIAPAAASGAPPLGTGTTIYEPTILGGGGGGGGTTSSVLAGSGHQTDVGVGHVSPTSTAGLSFAQWLYQFRAKGGASSAGGIAANEHNISVDPQLSPAQKLQLENLYGGGPAHRGPVIHPAGTAAERVAPILPGYAGGA